MLLLSTACCLRLEGPPKEVANSLSSGFQRPVGTLIIQERFYMRAIRFRSSLVVLSLAASAVSFVSAQSAQTAAPQPSPAKSPAALPPAKQLMDKHLKAIGGREQVLAHSSTHAVGTMAMPASGVSGKLEVFAAKPNKTLMRSTIAGIGSFEEGFDGNVGWSVDPLMGPTLFNGVRLEQKKFDSDFYAGLNDDQRYESIATVEETTFDGRQCYKVRLVRGGGGEDFVFFDKATGLRAGMMATRESPMGPFTTTSVEGDYKRFGKVLHPTRITSSIGPQQIVLTFDTIEFDTVDPAVFELPAQIKALIK
jgi:hypothetical protein